MALTYDLGLARDVAPGDALAVVREVVGGEMSPDGELVIRDGLVASCERLDDAFRKPFQELWGFDALVEVSFSQGNKADAGARETDEDLIAIASANLAVRLDTDAGLTFQFETRRMRRQHGALTLYVPWRPWETPAVLSKIPQPYSQQPTPR